MEVHIGKMIRERLNQRSDLTIKSFAEKLGIHEQTVYDIYKRADVSTELLRKISEILNVPVSDFFSLTSSENQQSKHNSDLKPEHKIELSNHEPELSLFERAQQVEQVEKFISENRYIKEEIKEEFKEGVKETKEAIPFNNVKVPQPVSNIAHQDYLTQLDIYEHTQANAFHQYEPQAKMDLYVEKPQEIQPFSNHTQPNSTSKANEVSDLAERLVKTHLNKSEINSNKLESSMNYNTETNIEIANLQEKLRIETEKNRLYEKIISDKEHIIRLLEAEINRNLKGGNS